MSLILQETSCCGLRDIEGLCERTPKEAMINVCYDFFRDEMDSAFILFTGVTKKRYGQKFKKYILDNKLGTVIETESKRNPNSSNRIKTWVWTLNVTKLKSWFKINRKDMCVDDECWSVNCLCKECKKHE